MSRRCIFNKSRFNFGGQHDYRILDTLTELIILSHGKKKWIRDYRGKIKRSRKKTRLDYLGDLLYWEPAGLYVGNKKSSFCPQCKHIQKQIPDGVSFYFFHWRSLLCWKCERKQEIKERAWRKFPGWKNRYSWVVRQERRSYRAKAKQLMREGKYDEISPNKRGWLD